MSGSGTLEPVDVALHESAIAPVAVSRVSRHIVSYDPYSGHWPGDTQRDHDLGHLFVLYSQEYEQHT